MWWLRHRSRHAEWDGLSDIKVEESDKRGPKEPAVQLDGYRVSRRLNNGTWLQTIIALIALWYMACAHSRPLASPSISIIMIFTFIGLGLLVHRKKMRYVVAMERA